jgi:hypothetical protein
VALDALPVVPESKDAPADSAGFAGWPPSGRATWKFKGATGEVKEKAKSEPASYTMKAFGVGNGMPAALPRKLLFHCKRVGRSLPVDFDLPPVLGYGARVLGQNCQVPKTLWTKTCDFFATERTLEWGEHELYSLLVDKADLDFVAELAESLKDGERWPTHVGSCLVAIQSEGKDGSRWDYFCGAAANMSKCSTWEEVPKLCTGAEDSGVHTEKFEMGLVVKLLEAYGLDLRDKSEQKGDPAVLSALGHFARSAVGAGDRRTVTAVYFYFLNVGPLCPSCVGYWAAFRATLLKKIATVHGCQFFYKSMTGKLKFG